MCTFMSECMYVLHILLVKNVQNDLKHFLFSFIKLNKNTSIYSYIKYIRYT